MGWSIVDLSRTHPRAHYSGLQNRAAGQRKTQVATRASSRSPFAPLVRAGLVGGVLVCFFASPRLMQEAHFRDHHHFFASDREKARHNNNYTEDAGFWRSLARHAHMTEFLPNPHGRSPKEFKPKDHYVRHRRFLAHKSSVRDFAGGRPSHVQGRRKSATTVLCERGRESAAPGKSRLSSRGRYRSSFEQSVW